MVEIEVYSRIGTSGTGCRGSAELRAKSAESELGKIGKAADVWVGKWAGNAGKDVVKMVWALT